MSVERGDHRMMYRSDPVVDGRGGRLREFVHATFQDDLIGPGHIYWSRSRSTTVAADKGQRGRRSSSAKRATKSGAERGRFIVFDGPPINGVVVVNKENGDRESRIRNGDRESRIGSVSSSSSRWKLAPFKPTEPPVDYDKASNNLEQVRSYLRKARSMTDLDQELFAASASDRRPGGWSECTSPPLQRYRLVFY